MEGFPIIPILFLLFALYGKLRKNSRKASSETEVSPQPMREDGYEDMDVFETVEEPFEETPREKYDSRGILGEARFGTEEYREKYDFEKKRRTDRSQEDEKYVHTMNVSVKQRELKADRETHVSKEGLNRSKNSPSPQKFSALQLKEELLSDPKLLQKAFIMKEILDKPVSLRHGSGRKSGG